MKPGDLGKWKTSERYFLVLDRVERPLPGGGAYSQHFIILCENKIKEIPEGWMLRNTEVIDEAG